MIRDVKPQDATAITKIYNEYITNSIISFETEPHYCPVKVDK